MGTCTDPTLEQSLWVPVESVQGQVWKVEWNVTDVDEDGNETGPTDLSGTWTGTIRRSETSDVVLATLSLVALDSDLPGGKAVLELTDIVPAGRWWWEAWWRPDGADAEPMALGTWTIIGHSL